MTITTLSFLRPMRAVAFAGIMSLGACADTELNGKVFDLMGVSSAAQAAAKTEPKMSVRSGLVLPPSAERLPEPGSATDESAASLSAVDDPDRRRAMAEAEKVRLHKAYCSGQMNWKERLNDKDATPKSPYGPCGILGETLNKAAN